MNNRARLLPNLETGVPDQVENLKVGSLRLPHCDAYFKPIAKSEIIKQTFDTLAGRISREISKSGICTLHPKDLALIWGENHQHTDLEKQLHVENFSLQYGFLAIAQDDFESVLFRTLK